MMSRKIITTLTCLAVLALLWAGPAAAGWKAMEPGGQGGTQQQTTSPFALPEKAQSDATPQSGSQVAAPGVPAGESRSPFALPEKGPAPQPPSVSGDAGKSPFALPEKGAGSAATEGERESTPAGPEKTPAPVAATADPEGLMARGIAEARAGRLDQAASAFAAAAQANPDDPRAWNNLGLILRKQGKLDQAAEAYHQALQVGPLFAVAYKNLGVLLEQAGEPAMAADSYLKYVQLAPQAPDAAQVKKRALWLKSRGGGK